MIVDSDVIISLLRGHEPARAWMVRSRREAVLRISVVTVAEITAGIRPEEREITAELLDALDPIPIDATVARAAGELARTYRRSHAGISLADHFIAATAQVHGLPLATLNVKHFPVFKGLRPAF